MPISVVVGGQYGSEGKGKVAHFLAKQMRATVAIRVGGPNSGHTVIDPRGKPLIFKQLPTAAILPDVFCVLPPGSYIRPDVLLYEIELARLDKSRLLIDPLAVVVDDRSVSEEHSSSLQASIGSTQSGTGAAVVARLLRNGSVRLARDESMLQPFLSQTVEFSRERLNRNERVIIEGTQGFGLSVLHSPHYPYATSRDTTAAAFVSEAGLSPLDVDDIAMVLRAYPIRVAGNSGPLVDEISWADVTKESNSQEPLLELTSVTKQQRRIARFDPNIVRLALAHNRPTKIFLNHVDYFDVDCRRLDRLTSRADSLVRKIEKSINASIDFAGIGQQEFVRLTKSPVAKRA